MGHLRTLRLHMTSSKQMVKEQFEGYGGNLGRGGIGAKARMRNSSCI